MQAKVPVGAATIAGYGATIIGLVATVLVAVFNVDQEQAGLVASAVWTVVAFSWTQWGRYSQAKAAAERSSWGDEKSVASSPDEEESVVRTSRGLTTTTPSPSATIKNLADP